MTLILHFNEAAVSAMNNSTRLRVLMKKRGGKEFLGLRPSYRVSGKNMQLNTVKGEDGKISTELPSQFIKELKFSKPENGAAFFLKDIGYGWFILDDLPTDATTETPTVVVADSAHIKQAAREVKAEEKQHEDDAAAAKAKEDEDKDKQADLESEAALAPAARRSSAEELQAHFGVRDEEGRGEPGENAANGEVNTGDVVDAGTGVEAAANANGDASNDSTDTEAQHDEEKPKSKRSAAAAKSTKSKATAPIAKTTKSRSTAAKKSAAKKTATA